MEVLKVFSQSLQRYRELCCLCLYLYWGTAFWDSDATFEKISVMLALLIALWANTFLSLSLLLLGFFLKLACSLKLNGLICGLKLVVWIFYSSYYFENFSAGTVLQFWVGEQCEMLNNWEL